MQDFFPRVGFFAFPFVPGAVVVNVASLLQLSDEAASTMSTSDQRRVGEVVNDLPVSKFLAGVKPILHTFPSILADQRFERSSIKNSLPLELAGIDPIAENYVDAAHVDSAGSEGDPFCSQLFGDALQSVLAALEPLENLAHDRCLNGMGRDGAFAVAALDVLVARWRKARPDPALGLLTHPLAGLLAKILDIVLRHEHLDAVEKLLRRTRLRPNDDVLFRKVDVNAEVINGHPVFEVAIEPISFFDNKCSAVGSLLQEREHSVEGHATGNFRGLDVHKLAEDLKVLLGSVIA
ncbi:MAG TPA: hypothetical protein VIY49_06955 [Bryobacteraceae bacterium]